GRRDSYGIPGFQHSKIAMARFALRVTTASALIFAAMTAADPVLCRAWAQETERPFGLFGIFNGTERMGGGSAPAAGAERTAQSSDLVLRLERLETQIRQMTGAIEQLQFRNQQLEGQIRRMQEEGVPRPAAQSRPQNLPTPSSPTVTPGARPRPNRPPGAAMRAIPPRTRSRPARPTRAARSPRPAGRPSWAPMRASRRSALPADAARPRRSISQPWGRPAARRQGNRRRT